MPRLRVNPLVLLPPLLFAAFAAVAFFGLKRENASELPSALVGRTAPAFDRTIALRDDPPPTSADLTEPGVKLVNFWASWCAPCRVEHPVLQDLAADGVPIIGVNYKDDPEKALGFLDELGDPFVSIGADPEGRTGLDWGLYGVPETFVIDGDGTVLLRHPGPITRDVLDRRILPAIDAAR